MTHVRTITGLFVALTTVALAASCGGDGGTTVPPVDPPAPQNRAPVPVGSIGALTIDVGATVTTDVASNFNDPDGDALTYSAATSDGGVAAATVSGSQVATTGVAAGTATITITARDPGGLTATQTMAVTVEAVNSPPTVTGSIDDRTLNVGDSVTVDVAASFSDPDGDELAFAATSSDAAVATASVSGSTLTVMAVATGSATVTVTATDTGGLAAEVGFTVTVEQPNRAPVVADTIPAQTMTVGDTVRLVVSLYFTDPDGDELSYEAVSADTGVAEALAMGDTVMIAARSAGEITVAVTASDPEGLTVAQDVMVTVQAPQNDPPVAVGAIAAVTVDVGATDTTDVATNFNDPDGDPLTYSAATSDGGVATATVSGSVVTTTGVAAGTATITITARDPGGLTATQTMAVTVEAVNSAPTVTGSIDDGTLNVGDSVTIDVAANFSDPDGDELAFAATSSDTAVATASVSGSMVEVMAIAVGSATVTVTATDTGGLAAELGFTVTVEQPNRAPEVADAIPAQTMTVGDTVKLVVSMYFTDPDGDELSYEAVSADTGVAEALAMGDTVQIAAMNAGEVTVAVTASDPKGLTVAQDVMVTVQARAQNRAPEASDSIPAHDLVTDSAVVLDVSAYFSDPDEDELTYTASSSDETIAVATVDGSVVTTMGVSTGEEAVQMVTLTVTATDPKGLSVTQEADVTVAAMDYEVWEGLTIGTEGDDKGKLQFALGTTVITLPGCVSGQTVALTAPTLKVNSSEWQVRKGTGWVRVPGTRREPADLTEEAICPYEELIDGSAPAGTYRVVGDVTITEQGMDPVRFRRKTENEFVHNPES